MEEKGIPHVSYHKKGEKNPQAIVCVMFSFLLQSALGFLCWSFEKKMQERQIGVPRLSFD